MDKNNEFPALIDPCILKRNYDGINQSYEPPYNITRLLRNCMSSILALTDGLTDERKYPLSNLHCASKNQTNIIIKTNVNIWDMEVRNFL